MSIPGTIPPWLVTKNTLRAQTVAYGAPLPGDSAITPTITVGAANAAPTLSGPLVGFADPRFLYQGGSVQGAGASFPDTQFYKLRNVTYDPAVPTFSGLGQVSFKITGQAFEFLLKGLGPASQFRLKIDGLYDPLGPHDLLPLDGNLYFIKVDLGSAATRTITIEGTAYFYFGGVVQNTGETLSAPVVNSPLRLIALGDSFVEGVGAVQGQSGFVYVAGSLLGFADIWASGSGGTGWVQTISGRVALSDRWASDALMQAPDVGIVAMGLNDIGTGNDATVACRALTSIASLRLARPACPIYVCGPWDVAAPSAPPAGYAAIRSAMQATAAISGSGFIDLQGVSFTKIGDGTHPDPAGHVTLGNYIANAVKTDLGLPAS